MPNPPLKLPEPQGRAPTVLGIILIAAGVWSAISWWNSPGQIPDDKGNGPSASDFMNPPPPPPKVFTATDFIWDKTALPEKYKDTVIAAVNLIHAEDSRCQQDITPSSTSLAGQQSRKGHPVFYVTCGHGRDAVNVYFTPEDVKKGNLFTAPTYFQDAEGQGRTDCQRFAKQQANMPATVDFDMGARIEKLPDGRTIITEKFTAKNAFGVPDRLAAICTFNSDEMTDGEVRRITN